MTDLISHKKMYRQGRARIINLREEIEMTYEKRIPVMWSNRQAIKGQSRYLQVTAEVLR